METTPGWIDTHVHLDSCAPVAQALHAARDRNVRRFVVPGVRSKDWPRLLQLAGEHADVFAAPGLHPMASHEWSPQLERQLVEQLRHPRVVAVGEVGLDRQLEGTPLHIQREALRGQLRVAIAVNKPVLIHCRKAYGELLSILIEEGAERVGGILHGFSGSLETARSAIDLGFVIAFGGSLTWPEARKAPAVLTALPPESIVLESDAPDLAPHPHRGEENRPAWLTLVAARVAELRGWSLQQTAEITSGNALRVLNLTN